MSSDVAVDSAVSALFVKACIAVLVSCGSGNFGVVLSVNMSVDMVVVCVVAGCAAVVRG